MFNRKFNIISTITYTDGSTSEHICETWDSKKQAKANARFYNAVAEVGGLRFKLERVNAIAISYRVEKA